MFYKVLESSRLGHAHLLPAHVGAVALNLVYALLVAGHLAYWEVARWGMSEGTLETLCTWGHPLTNAT
jgi:hypothetical protein